MDGTVGLGTRKTFNSYDLERMRQTLLTHIPLWGENRPLGRKTIKKQNIFKITLSPLIFLCVLSVTQYAEISSD